MKKLILILILLSLCPFAQTAQDIIPEAKEGEQVSVPVINDEIRKVYSEISTANTDIDALDARIDILEAVTVPAVGAAVDKTSSYANQVAATDGFVFVYCNDDNDSMDLKTDGNNPPTTIYGIIRISGGDIPQTSMMVVKEGNRWLVTANGGTPDQVLWVPLE